MASKIPFIKAVSLEYEKSKIIEKYGKKIDTVSSYFEDQYIRSLFKVITDGKLSGDRTKTGTFRLETGYKFEFSNIDIPLLRGKSVNPQNALTEVIWILCGRNDLKFLKDNGVNYWDEWVKEDGTFGPIYGTQMRNFGGVDQLLNVINKLNQSPETRQAMISLWNPIDLPDMALPCCHMLYHPLIVNGKLNLHCGQRSSDSILGVPYDYMLFWFIQQILAYLTRTEPGFILHNNHDYHMYVNHIDVLDKYLDNYLNNPKDLDLKDNQIKIDLKFPERPEELTSETLTKFLIEFHLMNNKLDTNYEKNVNHYPLIKAIVAV